MDAIKSTNKPSRLSLVHKRKAPAATPKIRVSRGNLPEKIALPTMDGIQFEEVRNIVTLEAQGNYTFIHLIDGKKILVCKTLHETEENLRSDAFVRVHRSHTVNMYLITKYVKGKGGYVIMENGTVVNVSAGRKASFLQAVQLFF